MTCSFSFRVCSIKGWWLLLLLLLLPTAFGEYIKVDKEALSAGMVKAKVHAIKGSGGYVGLDDLDFTQTAGDDSMTVDLFLFKLPDNNDGDDSCADYAGTLSLSLPQATPACYLKDAGLGATLADGSTAYCCTQELAGTGMCSQVGRAITTPYFRGDHRYVNLSPQSGPQSSYFRDLDEAGQYAMLIMNCDEEATVTLDGRIEWESYPGGYEIWQEADMEFASDFEQMARTCGIDVDFFTEGPAGAEQDDDMAFINSVEDYLSTLAETCTAAQVETLNAAFDDFHTCAGFDLQLFIEDLPSAVLGTAIECIATFNWTQFQDIDWEDIDQVANMEVSPACLNFEFGANAVGYGLRQMALHPDKLIACFKDFSPQVPECMVELYPIPLLGTLLKPATCMVGEMSSMLDDLLKIEMGVWDTCLPDNPKAANCENSCLYEGSILMRGGNMALPVSDTMERLAAADKGRLKSALERYKKHLLECTDEWSGWTEFDGTTQADRHKVSSSSSSSGGGSRGLRDFGMLLVGLLFGSILAVVYERVQRKKAFKQTEKQLELTEGSYADQSDDHGIL